MRIFWRPVGIAIILVVALKYILVLTSNPVVYIWWAHTKLPIKPIEPIAYIIPIFPNISFLYSLIIASDINPKAGNIMM